MSFDSNEEKIKDGWILLGSIDESALYEVDENHILYHPGSRAFLLRSASGCSCWEGEYDETQYRSLDEIEAALTSSAGATSYNPTLAGAKELLREAREAYAKL